jgi:hypothetical protein
MLRRFLGNEQGSATRWFAVMAAVLTVAAMASVQGLSWMTRSGRVPVIAFLPPRNSADAVAASGVDMTPIGVIKPAAQRRSLP